MTMLRTTELSRETVGGVSVALESGTYVELGVCPECHQPVAEGPDLTSGHKMTCKKPSITNGPTMFGWHIPINPSMLEGIFASLAGLTLQVGTQGGDFFLCPREGYAERGHWDLAEAFMRLGFLPPAEIARDLEVLPEGGHSIRRLWTLRGAKRSLKITREIARADEVRLSKIMREMFPRSGLAEGQLGLGFGEHEE